MVNAAPPHLWQLTYAHDDLVDARCKSHLSPSLFERQPSIPVGFQHKCIILFILMYAVGNSFALHEYGAWSCAQCWVRRCPGWCWLFIALLALPVWVIMQVCWQFTQALLMSWNVIQILDNCCYHHDLYWLPWTISPFRFTYCGPLMFNPLFLQHQQDLELCNDLKRNPYMWPWQLCGGHVQQTIS